MGDQETTIQPAKGKQDLKDVKKLFTEYAVWLKIDLEFQGFAQELNSLPGNYNNPGGEILLARDKNNRAIGCIALRPLDVERKICEMKRLYILPEGRNLGLGQCLVREILVEAKRRDYHEMRLDTLSSMTSAISLYEKLGFLRIDAYYDTPLRDTVFLAKKPL